ncbi:hypothetical protein CHM34_03090 [Paludifilum halophilum]|uniref:Uncharacterized protein n=1 Tax=Paludifilum halophilum TaxID=1642702 RepID=A0A235BA82_9BACL|nr:hypothetical protein CHM34_03090 [Paludifilum halophilum]
MVVFTWHIHFTKQSGVFLLSKDEFKVPSFHLYQGILPIFVLRKLSLIQQVRQTIIIIKECEGRLVPEGLRSQAKIRSTSTMTSRSDKMLEDVRRGEKKSFVNLVLKRLEKWQGLCGATSAVDQVISTVMDATVK